MSCPSDAPVPAQVAKMAVTAFNPDAVVVAHHGNVKNPEFGIDFFRKFDIVMSALDNVSARRCVSGPCAGCPVCV